MKPKPIFKLDPAGLMDRGDPRVTQHAGADVQKVQPYGCPRNGTMGMCYVQLAESGKFIGLVSLNSLVATGRRQVVRDLAAEARSDMQQAPGARSSTFQSSSTRTGGEVNAD